MILCELFEQYKINNILPSHKTVWESITFNKSFTPTTFSRIFIYNIASVNVIAQWDDGQTRGDSDTISL